MGKIGLNRFLIHIHPVSPTLIKFLLFTPLHFRNKKKNILRYKNVGGAFAPASPLPNYTYPLCHILTCCSLTLPSSICGVSLLAQYMLYINTESDCKFLLRAGVLCHYNCTSTYPLNNNWQFTLPPSAAYIVFYHRYLLNNNSMLYQYKIYVARNRIYWT